MVLSNGAKNARNAQKISNRPTCGGGAKKAGTAPKIGWIVTSNLMLTGAAVLPPQNVLVCPNYGHVATRTQRIGYRATLGP